MSMLNLSVIIATVFLSACAQLLFKLGVNALAENQGIFDNGIQSIVKAVFSPLVFSGLVVYGVSVIVWLWVLSKVDLSLAYPFVGLSFIMTLVFGAFVLNEPVNSLRVIGTMLIAVGCLFVARS